MSRLLLVNPDETESGALGSMLHQHLGLEITRVSTVIEAIRTAGAQTFDAAVLDYELPDGTGLDLLDFLRIGSPGIRIMMLSTHVSEEVAFHALSHGAGDYLVKDRHLEQELARRVGVLLEGASPHAALVETLVPTLYDPAKPDIRAREDETPLEACLRGIVGGSALAAGVFDHRGRPVALRLPPNVEGDGLGFALATIHGQVGSVWTYGRLRPVGYTMLVDVEGGVLGVTAIPGTHLLAVLFDAAIHRPRALEKLERAAARIAQALRA